MEVTLPTDLSEQVQQEITSGRYRNADDLIEQAVRSFLDSSQERLAALRRLGRAVDDGGLYERAFIPDQQ